MNGTVANYSVWATRLRAVKNKKTAYPVINKRVFPILHFRQLTSRAASAEQHRALQSAPVPSLTS